MREIISIDKDFLNNKETLTTKQKPKSRAKGKVTVSLFDEKGNKQREIKTENIVYDWVKAYSFKNAYLTNFGLGTMGAKNNANICTDNHTGVLPLSKYLMLFNGDHEDTNPKKSLIKDELVGYAGRYEEYSGSDILKGTYNSVESKTSIDKEGNIVFHMVYDFPTHSANGNITGVGLGHTYERNKELMPTKCKYRNSDTGLVLSYLNVTTKSNKDGSLYFGALGSSNTNYSAGVGLFDRCLNESILKHNIGTACNYKSYQTTPGSNKASQYGYRGYDEETEQMIITYVNNSTFVKIAETNGKDNPILKYGDQVNFMYSIVGNNGKITDYTVNLKYDFCNLLNLRDVATSINSGTCYFYPSLLVGKDKIFLHARLYESQYTSNISSSITKHYIFIFDREGNYERHIDVTDLMASYSSTYKVIPYGTDEFLICVEKGEFVKANILLDDVSIVSASDLNIYNKDKIDLSVVDAINKDYFASNYNEKVLYLLDKYNSYESNYILKDDRINLSSYTRLPSPVTKTNIHTMKVQYDLVIEDVSVYDYIEY